MNVLKGRIKVNTDQPTVLAEFCQCQTQTHQPTSAAIRQQMSISFLHYIHLRIGMAPEMPDIYPRYDEGWVQVNVLGFWGELLKVLWNVSEGAYVSDALRLSSALLERGK